MNSKTEAIKALNQAVKRHIDIRFKIVSNPNKWMVHNLRFDEIKTYSTKKRAEKAASKTDDPTLVGPERLEVWEVTDNFSDEIKTYKSLSSAKRAVKAEDNKRLSQDGISTISILSIYK